jgi:glycosyltransferase involved in cell wall biosynthesis
MRILQVSNFSLPVAGGMEVYVDGLSAELAGRGHEVHLATLTRGATLTDPRVEAHPIGTLSARVIHYDRADRPFPPPLPDPLARRQLAELVDRLDPDVVHVHSALGLSLPAHIKPTVLTLHDYAAACQLGTLWTAGGQVCTGPSVARCVSCGSHTYGPARSAAMTVATAVGRRFSKPDAVLALSEQVRRVMSTYCDTDIEVIPGFYRPPEPVLEPEGLPDGPFALFAGDPREHKGIGVLLDAWRHTCLVGLGLVIATTRPIERPLPSGVRCLSLRPEAMGKAWQRATVAVVPSLWAEPFGLVAVEALAAGTPVVAFRSGALPEIVTDGVDGLLVEPGDSRALAEAVASLADQPDVLKSMGSAAISAAERFAPGSIVPRIEAVYRRVIASARSRG